MPYEHTAGNAREVRRHLAHALPLHSTFDAIHVLSWLPMAVGAADSRLQPNHLLASQVVSRLA